VKTEKNEPNMQQMASKNLIAIWLFREWVSAHDDEKQIRRKKRAKYIRTVYIKYMCILFEPGQHLQLTEEGGEKKP